MKKGLKIFYCLTVLCALIGVSGCDGNKKEGASASQMVALQDNEIYFFYYDECPYCHDAIGYIKEKHPNLKMSMQDVKTKEGMALFEKCAEKFGLGDNVGTPLFCIGGTYIMGWSEQNAVLFEEAIEPFLKYSAF